MTQKVISVNVTLKSGGDGYTEYEFEKLNKYLEDGYVIFDKFQSASSSPNAYSINYTFILRK